MAYSIVLYYEERADIRISIDARFDGEVLIIDGYDIGKTVESYWGDSDYEYMATIPPDSVVRLYDLLGVDPGNKQELLNELAKRFHTNSCYSDIRKLMDDHRIVYEGFTWS